MSGARALMPWLGALLISVPGHAATIDRLDVTRGNGSQFTLHMRARLDTRAAEAHRVLSDIAQLPRLNHAIESAEEIPSPTAHARRARTRVRMCVWKFCARLNQVQDIIELPTKDGYALQATVIPELSNLRNGTAEWSLRDCGTQTCLHFEAQLTPDFWIPPLIGTRAVQSVLSRHAILTAEGIERLANTPPRAP